MSVEKERLYLEKGLTGQLDNIFHIMSLLPNHVWQHVNNDPDTDMYVMLKTVTVETKVTIKD